MELSTAWMERVRTFIKVELSTNFYQSEINYAEHQSGIKYTKFHRQIKGIRRRFFAEEVFKMTRINLTGMYTLW